MDRHERQEHSSSFGAVAEAYAEHRPDYARAAVRWTLEPAPGPRVLDLGAGTGKLTATLAELAAPPELGASDELAAQPVPATRDELPAPSEPVTQDQSGTPSVPAAPSAEVVAVEPDPAMLAELRRTLPTVRALPGRAEEIPLPTGSVDAVLSGNAMHWFDMATAGPEIARVLAPQGILAGLWNVMDDRVDWVAGLAEISGDAAIGPRDLLGSWRAATADMHLPKTGEAARFGSPQRAEFAHRQRRSADSLVATLATRAGILVMPEREREATLRRIRDYLATRAETADGRFTLPMLTCVLRVRRL